MTHDPHAAPDAPARRKPPLADSKKREHAAFIQFDHFALASDAPLGDDRAAELCWLVADIDDAWQTLKDQARVRMPLRSLPFGRIFSIDDADGHPCYVMQWAEQRPSQPA